jgi:hypothetical protein
LFLNFGFSFLLPQVIKSTSIYRGWKRAIFFSIGKNFNNSRLPELVTLDRVGASVLSFGLNGPYPRIERCQLSGDDFCSGVVKFGGH